MITRTQFVNIIHGPYRCPLVKAAGTNLSVRLVHRLASLAIGRRDVVAIAARFQALHAQSFHPSERAQLSW